MDKQLMHLTNEEVEFLRSFVGKEMVGEEGASILFSDGSVLTVENEIRDDVPFHGRDEDGYADWDNEGGVIRLHDKRIYKDVRPAEEISKEKLPVPHVVQKVYVLNETVTYCLRETEKEPYSFIRTYGIVLDFTNVIPGEEEEGEESYFLYISQNSWWGGGFLESGIARHSGQCIRCDVYEHPLNLHNSSMIRVG